MQIGIVYPKPNKNVCVNYDLNTFGTAIYIGNSISSKIIERLIKKTLNFPSTHWGYLASIFIKDEHNVKLISSKYPSLENIDIAFIPVSIANYKQDIETAKKIKIRCKAKIGFIGSFPSVRPDIFLENGDFVIKGEPEEALIKISKGEIFPEGTITSSIIMDLDSLPYPNWDIFPIKDYSYPFATGGIPFYIEKPILPILSSRGCTYPCKFYCPYTTIQTNWRARSVSNVVSEIEYLVDRYKVKWLIFRDPHFTLDNQRTKKIAQEIINRKINVKWICDTHLNTLNKEIIDLLYEAGLRVINIGIESVNSELLKKINRTSVRIARQEEIINYCEKKGILIYTLYILGLPEETKSDLEETIAYALKLNTHFAQFSIFTPYPGTAFYDTIKVNINENNWEKYNQYTPVFLHHNLSGKELLYYKEKAFKLYYFRLSWVLKLFITYLKILFNNINIIYNKGAT